MKVISTTLLGVLLLMSNYVHASDLVTAFKEGSAKFNFRYRHEFVDDDNIDRQANASTLRSRVSWNSGKIGGFDFVVEADHVAVVGDERFNSTENGLTEFPVVADPEGFDLNQSFIRYQGKKLTATGGRQRINHADQRFIGGVAWRQNEQTYDAVRAQYKFNDNVSVDYSYVFNVNRIFGPDDGAQPSDWRSNSHFLSADVSLAEGHSLQGFSYLLDFENDNGLPNSTATYGLTYTGKVGWLGVKATLATQSDYADSPLDYRAEFVSLALDGKFKPINVRLGYELLGSDDGVAAFRTPLATLHKFQGFADRFLLTPADGIEDLNVGVSRKFGKVGVALTYHQFKADESSLDYGDEINAVVNVPIRDRIKLQLKYANYQADDFSADKQLVWTSLIVSL